MRKAFLFTFLIILIKFSIADDALMKKVAALKTSGKISLEIIDQQTRIGIKSKIIITDNKLYFQAKNTDSLGKLNMSLPAGTYQIYTISNGYNIQVSNDSVFKDSTTNISIGLNKTQNLNLDTTKFYVSGFIVDKETNKPISKAIIIDTKANILATTDSIGYFQFIQEEMNKIKNGKYKNSYKLNTINLNIVKPNYDIIYLKDYIPFKGLNTIKIFLSKGNSKQKIKYKVNSLINNVKG
jgi:hypothetical protein